MSPHKRSAATPGARKHAGRTPARAPSTAATKDRARYSLIKECLSKRAYDTIFEAGLRKPPKQFIYICERCGKYHRYGMLRLGQYRREQFGRGTLWQGLSR